MSILSSTGAGLSSKYYIGNIHHYICYQTKLIAVDAEYGLLPELTEYNIELVPIFKRAKKMSWIKRDSIYKGKPVCFTVSASDDRVYSIYNECLEKKKDFVEVFSSLFKKALNTYIKEKYDNINENNNDELICFELVSDNFGTENINPDNKSANDYV